MDLRNQYLWKRTYLGPYSQITLEPGGSGFKKSIVYLDSMGQTGKTICETIFQYLQNESKTLRNIELDPLEWKQYSTTSEEIPQQVNGSDSGIFHGKYADYILRDQTVTFSQKHRPIFRKRKVWKILQSLSVTTSTWLLWFPPLYFSTHVSNLHQVGWVEKI